MTPKCFNCSSNLSLAWFTLSFSSTKHRCVNCGTLHGFTNKHKAVGLLFIIPLFALYIFSESIIPWDIVRFLVLLALSLSLVIIVPGQHIQILDDRLDIKKKT